MPIIKRPLVSSSDSEPGPSNKLPRLSVSHGIGPTPDPAPSKRIERLEKQVDTRDVLIAELESQLLEAEAARREAEQEHLQMLDTLVREEVPTGKCATTALD